MTEAGQRTDYMSPDEERIGELECECEELLCVIRADHKYKAEANVIESQCICKWCKDA